MIAVLDSEVEGDLRPPSSYPLPIRRRPEVAVHLAIALLTLLVGTFIRAAEVIPPAPRDHFNDYAGLVERSTATQLNRELEQFERDTSNQIVVAIFPKMQSESSVEDYTVRVFQAWGVGQKERKNGAVLFIFSQDRKLRIVTGYGLEGALPDALCKQIIEGEITPRFRNSDFTGGVAAGTRAMMAAARGEYRGSGRTNADRNSGSSGGGVFSLLPFIFFIIIAIAISRARRRNTVLGRRGVWVDHTPWWGGGGGFGGGGGGWGSSGGSGGSFSGGGGSTGGGGAGGSW